MEFLEAFQKLFQNVPVIIQMFWKMLTTYPINIIIIIGILLAFIKTKRHR